MPERLIEVIRHHMVSGLFVFLFALLGRLMWHVRLVQNERRKFWSKHLVWELLTALSIGFVAKGLAVYLGLSGHVETGLIIVVSYLGPHGIESTLVRLAKLYTKK